MEENEAIINKVREIIKLSNHIRDIFPDDMPYLWDKLSPDMDEIENQARMIVKLVRTLEEK